MPDTTLDRARAAVLHQMGWEDDRQAGEWAGAIWDAATDVAQAVLDVAEADRQLAAAAQTIATEQAIARMANPADLFRGINRD